MSARDFLDLVNWGEKKKYRKMHLKCRQHIPSGGVLNWRRRGKELSNNSVSLLPDSGSNMNGCLLILGAFLSCHDELYLMELKAKINPFLSRSYLGFVTAKRWVTNTIVMCRTGLKELNLSKLVPMACHCFVFWHLIVCINDFTFSNSWGDKMSTSWHEERYM